MSSNYLLKRSFDFLMALLLLLIALFPLLILIVLIKITSKGPAIHWSKRIGRHNKIYLMPKLRSMYIETPQVATDLLSNDADKFITPIGKIVRKTSLDELPQLWSVLVGDMSLVGPRPALFNQYNLRDIRTSFKVDQLMPGITGWAQINGRDSVTDLQKAELDKYYLENQSFFFDIKILFLTAFKVLSSKNVSH